MPLPAPHRPTLRAALAATAAAWCLPAAALDDRAVAARDEGDPPPAVVTLVPGDTSTAMKRARSGTPLVKVKVNGVEGEFGLDTGAGLTVISESVARRTGARPLAGPPAVKDSLGRSVAARLAEVDLEVGPLRYKGLPVLVLPDASLSAKLLGMFTLFSFEGLVGWHALQPVRTEVDFEEGRVTFSPPARDCGARNLWSRAYKPLADARIAGEPVIAFIDTGAQRTWALAGRRPWERILSTTRSASVVGGASGTAVRAVDKASDVPVAVGARRMTLESLSVREGAEGADHDATIGMDVIGAGRMTIDLACGEFRLDPPK